MIGREIINAERVGLGIGSGSQSLVDTFYQDTFGIVNGSAGLKYKTRKNVCLQAIYCSEWMTAESGAV